MRKVLATGLLAICVIAASHQEASAWVNARFGIGLNFSWQSGGNSCFWGSFQNGAPPGGGPFMPSGGTYYPYYSRHYLHSPHAPVYYGANEMPTQQQPAYAQPGFAPLYHNATYQRPER